MAFKTISVDADTYGVLDEIRARFSRNLGVQLSWNEFMKMAGPLLNSVKEINYKMDASSRGSPKARGAEKQTRRNSD